GAFTSKQRLISLIPSQIISSQIVYFCSYLNTVMSIINKKSLLIHIFSIKFYCFWRQNSLVRIYNFI
ncbi:hypothetical protein DMU17_22720, partial [Salmonella enterica]|nr:hypothetical protein [Salmonella enterica]